MKKETGLKYCVLEIKIPENADEILKQVISFLQLFLPETLAKRLVALILLAIGVSVKDAIGLTGLSERSLWSLKKSIRETPVAELMVIKSGSGRKAKTKGLEEQILTELDSHNYHTRQEIADMIEEKFHVCISRSTVGRLLKKNGFRWLKSGSIPAKADPQKQKDFFDTTLHPLMEKAKEGNIALLFLDASHFVMGCDFLGHIYSRTRRFIKTFSGRMRYNVLGAMDYVTKEVLTVTNDSYITASEVCDLLKKIKAKYEQREVHLVLDNARYQKCRVVQDLAGQLDIHLEYIPPYSPNLNLIERLWKFIKGDLSSKYYNDFKSFCEKIDSLLAAAADVYKSRIDSLIGKGVQLFNDLLPVGENTFSLAGKGRISAV